MHALIGRQKKDKMMTQIRGNTEGYIVCNMVILEQYGKKRGKDWSWGNRKGPGAIGCTNFGSCLDSVCLEWEGVGARLGQGCLGLGIEVGRATLGL